MFVAAHPREYAGHKKLLLVVAGLIGVEAIVAATASTGLALLIAAALLAGAVVYLALRRPAVVMLVALSWIALEKVIEPHLTFVDPTTVDTYGDYALVLALLWTLLLNMLRRRVPLFTLRQIGPPLVAFVALGIVSAAINNVPRDVAQSGILSTTHTMIMFLVLVNIGVEERYIYRYLAIVFAFMVVSDFVGVLQFSPSSPAWKLAAAAPGNASNGFVRVYGLFDYSNSLADYTALALPLGLTPLLFGTLRGHRRVLTLCAILIMVAALLLTGSREAWGALLVATLFLGLTVERRLLRAFVVGILPVLVGGALLFEPFLGRLLQVGNGGGRLQFFQASLPVIQDHLWLGAGPGRFGGHVALMTNSPLYVQYDLTTVFSQQQTQQIDMFWTHLLAESGILGLLVYFAAIVACFLVGRRAYRAAVTPRRKAALLGLLYAIPVAAFISLVAPMLEATNSGTLFWGLMGMLTVLAACPERAPQAHQAYIAGTPVSGMSGHD